jgi:hypothetical protein
MGGDRMARSGGPTSEGPTKSVRMYADEAELLYWIGEVTGLNSAKILSPMVRPSLSALYERHRAAIEQLKAMRQEEEKIREEAQRRGVDSPLEFNPELGEPRSSGPPSTRAKKPRPGS